MAELAAADGLTARGCVRDPETTMADPRRWKALTVLALIQFMLVLDITVVNVALPRIQVDLGFSRAGLAWVVNGYVLMAGGFLLLGGRIADILGRRRMFLVGVGLFALASVSCGAAQNPSMLVVSRFVQGLGEALAAPASLGLVALLFDDSGERAKALSIWAGLAGLGGAAGNVISGVLTDVASWRWTFLVNVPIALFALVTVPRLVDENRMVRTSRRPDIAGAVCATAGLICVVEGLLQAASHPWGSSSVVLALLAGTALLGLAVLTESRSAQPLIPLTFFSDRLRVVTNLVTLLAAAGLFSYFFLLTLYEQQIQGFSPLSGGLSYLPFGVAITVGTAAGGLLMTRVQDTTLMVSGYFGAAIGLTLTSFATVQSGYVAGVLPGMLLLGFACGLIFPAAGNAALRGVTAQDASLASGVQTAMHAIGGALGLATLVTLALRHAAAQVEAGASPAVAATHGYALAFRVGAALMIGGAVLVLALRHQARVGPGPADDGAARTDDAKASTIRAWAVERPCAAVSGARRWAGV